MISPSLSYPWLASWNIFFCCVVFLPYGKALWKVPKLLLGFLALLFSSVLSENAPPFYRTDPYFCSLLVMLCCASVGID
jgi:hypothetical protein